MGSSLRRLLAVLTLSAGVAAAVAGPAAASYHLIKIREVYPGSAAAPTSDYVVLQMTSGGQNFVDGHPLTVYDAGGSLTAPIPFTSSPDAGANQSTILLAGSGYSAAFAGGPAADLTDAGLNLSPAGGAVCWPDGIPADCVSWGNFTPPATGYPSPSTPNASPGGVADGKALRRSIAAGCPTLLEPGDDSNSSGADFSEQTPEPRANSSPVAEKACPPPPTPRTTIQSGPSGPTRDRTPTFRFRSSLAGSTFRCRIDGRAFAPCSSPKTFGPLGPGRHTFAVRAVRGGRADPSPATRSFTIKR